MLSGAGVVTVGLGFAAGGFVAAGVGGGGGGSFTFTGRDEEGNAGFFRLLFELALSFWFVLVLRSSVAAGEGELAGFTL